MADSAKDWMNANWSKWLKSGFPSLEEAFQAGVESVKKATKQVEAVPCACICHKVGLFGLMCCPCTVKMLDELVNGKPSVPQPPADANNASGASLSLQGRKQEK